MFQRWGKADGLSFTIRKIRGVGFGNTKGGDVTCGDGNCCLGVAGLMK